MKTIRKFALVLPLMAAALSLSVSHAAAQSIERGAFTLPVEARWGSAVLPAGSYEFSVDTAGAHPLVMVRSADGKIAGMFLARSISSPKTEDSQVLTLTKLGDTMYVSSLQLIDMGVLEYSAPKVAASPTVAGLTTP